MENSAEIHSFVSKSLIKYMNTGKSRDEKFLERAIELSKKGMEGGKGGPFGCIVVKGDEIIQVANLARCA